MKRLPQRPLGPGPLRPGFTLVELMVVIAIVAILAGLMVTAALKIHENANRSSCQHNLKQLALAVHNYHTTHKVLPPYATGKAGEIYGGWYVYLLPYVGRESLYQSIYESDLQPTSVFSPAVFGQEMRDMVFVELSCRSDPTGIPPQDHGKTNYLANWYAFTKIDSGFFSPPVRLGELTDGPGNTIFFAEGYNICDGLQRLAMETIGYHNFGVTATGKPSDDASFAPADYTMFQVQPEKCDRWRAQTNHSSMPVALGDGSVRFISPDIAPDTWRSLLKPADGLPADGNW